MICLIKRFIAILRFNFIFKKLGLIRNIKTILALSKLKSSYKKNKSRTIVCNLDDAKKVGVIYDATNEKDLLVVKNFIKKLKETVPEVDSIGYFSKKTNKDQQHLNKEFPLFYKQNINWYWRPDNEETENFTKKQFDILIDLKLTDCIPLKFILVESKSNFKVGRKSEKFPDFYDFMLQVDDNTTLEYFTEQVLLYLKMINKKK